MSDGGKGSSPRPFSVSNDEYANRWDAIFGRDKRVEEDQKIEDEAFSMVEKQNRERALDRMVQISQEMGLYDSDFDKIERNNVETQEVKNISR
jgi:hypothetical protein